MKHRYDFLHIYTSFHSLIRTQYSIIIKYLHSYLGGEYISAAFSELLLSDGTIHKPSCTITPQQNGVAERKHKHFVETTHSLILSAGVLGLFLVEAILTVVHLIEYLLPLHQVCLLMKTAWSFS